MVINVQLALQNARRLALQIVKVAPAACLWSSGVGLGRWQAAGDTERVVYLALLFTSAGASAIAHAQAFKNAHFGPIALALAMVCVVQRVVNHSAEDSTSDSLVRCLREYVTMLWAFSVAIVVANHRPARGAGNEQLIPAELPQFCSKRRYFLDWIALRNSNDEHSHQEHFSSPGSYYFRDIVGPGSQMAYTSNTSDTSISLPPNAPCVDSKRARRLGAVMEQATTVWVPAEG